MKSVRFTQRFEFNLHVFMEGIPSSVCKTCEILLISNTRFFSPVKVNIEHVHQALPVF